MRSTQQEMAALTRWWSTYLAWSRSAGCRQPRATRLTSLALLTVRCVYG